MTRRERICHRIERLAGNVVGIAIGVPLMLWRGWAVPSGRGRA